ncbi:uncharacterized protein DDB_G0290685-like [Crassostrea angulata]|uniref:uncharacterized protein DDB_G0290685-like n=1 Tax=Magallana angulata TaxID=2784310 RepID=UPI0022B0BB3B|nr:uncharacterized protein DDB_G0290685-like [Crassostrea angulata]
MFCWLLASVFLVTVKGQCLLNANDPGVVVSRCDPSVYKALVIHIDFYEINSPCTCNVTTKFTGNLFVLSKKSTAEECNTQIKINDDFMFDCPAPAGSNHTLHVQSNQIVHVKAEYTKPSKQGRFHQCLQIRKYGGNDGDLSVRCTASTASTTRSTTTTTSKTTSTTSTTPSTTTNLKSILTTTTPSTHSRSSSFVEPSKEATVTNNMNRDVITNSKETASVSFNSPTMKTIPDDSQKMIYIIAGFGLGVVIILIGLITCVLALTKRGKIERTKDKSTEEDSAPTNDNADSSNALRGNPLYVSSDEVEDIKCTEEEDNQQDKQQGDRYSSATNLESNRDHDDGPSINQPIDSIPVFPVPNNTCSNRSHSRRDVYAEVYKQNKSTEQVHDSVQTQNQNSLFYIGIE